MYVSAHENGFSTPMREFETFGFPWNRLAIRFAAAVVILLASLAGCSSDSDGGPTEPDPNVAIGIDPTATLLTGESATFTATVTGSRNTGVTWSASCGTISGQGATVTYTAPAEPGSCTVTATSQANPSKSASATVTVNDVVVAIIPSVDTLFLGQSGAFSATINGVDEGTFNWSATCGTVIPISEVFIEFRAPGQPGTCEITATSVEYPTRSAKAVVTVQAVHPLANHLGNGTFDSDLVAWNHYEDNGIPRAVWVDEDANGNPDSGSAEIHHPLPGNGGTRIGLSACLPAVPGQRLVVGGSARMVDVVEGASPQIWVRGFSIDDCNTNFLVNTLIMSFHEQATTTEWAALAREMVIPEGTVRIEIILGISKDDGVTESAAARFDNVFVVVVP